jgi:hypothetical protein
MIDDKDSMGGDDNDDSSNSSSLSQKDKPLIVVGLRQKKRL